MIYTCGSCKHLCQMDMMGCPLYFCGVTEAVVPQSSTEERTVFHRVPIECPLSKTDVKKSERPISKKYWVTVTHDAKESNPRVDRAGASPAQVQRVVGQTEPEQKP